MKYATALKVITAAMLALCGSPAVAEGAPGFASHSGMVVETMNSGGYTYAQIDEDGTKAWIAVPQTQLAPGDSLTYQEQMRMPNFRSKTLDRTFDEVLFATIVNPGAGAAAPAAAPAVPSAPGAASPVQPAPGATPSEAGTQTIEEIYARKDELKGQTVKVRGTVVKVSPNIMNKNWVHVQDGSGSEGSNDIIFTSTSGDVAVGEMVTAQGTVETDVDFGYGYSYSVIVQDSSFTK